MIAFATNVAVTVSKPSVATTSFKTALPNHAEPTPSAATTMILRTALRKPAGTGYATAFGAISGILKEADIYMSKCVKNQYLAMANPSGVFGLQCTEGSVKFAAEGSRVRALGTQFRALQKSPFKKYSDIYENRKNAIINSHGCSYEESLFSNYPRVAAVYNVAQSEATGSCFRYASPETVEEAAMLRYMDIQTKTSVNPTGVYNTSCNEGTVKNQAEEIRVAALNTAYRQGQKSTIKLLSEKYEQKKSGYAASHNCSYEEGLVSSYPSLGACFRSKSWGY